MESVNEGENIVKRNIPTIGGEIGFRQSDNPQVKIATQQWKEALHRDTWGFPPMKDPDFVENFISRITTPEEQLKYVLNTSKFLSRQGANDVSYDPEYVLVFRRSLPSNDPKSERHWTTEYITARRGLTREIPHGPHRLYSIILCSTLADVLKDGGPSSEPNSATSDGEIKVDTPFYDQKRCIISFRPKDQEEELKKYQKTDGAMSLESVLKQIKEIKKPIQTS